MGIPRTVARLLLDEHRSRPFSGRLACLSRMAVFFTQAEFESWAREQGVALAKVPDPRLSHDPALARQGCLDDQTFFRLLGFDQVVTLDYSRWEGAEVVHDLNLPLPAELCGRFDVVFEAGTLQHVFHLPQALASIHALLKPGGRVVHGMTTSNNHVDHGFYMFSPTLFHDFYAQNRWRLDAEFLFEFHPYWYRGRFLARPCPIYRYTEGCLDHLSYGGFGSKQVALFTVATRAPEATSDLMPQQSYFRRLWSEREAGQAPVPSASAADRPLSDRLDLLAGELADRQALLRPFYLGWKRARAELVRHLPRRMPPIVARY